MAFFVVFFKSDLSSEVYNLLFTTLTDNLSGFNFGTLIFILLFLKAVPCVRPIPDKLGPGKGSKHLTTNQNTVAVLSS